MTDALVNDAATSEYVVGWTAPWWWWAGLFAGCALLWPLRLAAAGLEASGRALADWVEAS